MIDRINLRQFIALINQCSLVIANDSGPLHIAVALRIKSVSLFGPVNEQVYGPYSPSSEHVVIRKDLNCRFCYRKFHLLECNYNLHCLREITVQEVVGEVEGLLK